MGRSGIKKDARKDTRAASPVIGVIVMIAITIIISVMVAHLTSAMLSDITSLQGISCVIEDGVGSTEVAIIHYGGLAVANAYAVEDSRIVGWDNISVTLDGKDIAVDKVMLGSDGDKNFESGEEMKITVPKLRTGDEIGIVYKPTGDKLVKYIV